MPGCPIVSDCSGMGLGQVWGGRPRWGHQRSSLQKQKLLTMSLALKTVPMGCVERAPTGRAKLPPNAASRSERPAA